MTDQIETGVNPGIREEITKQVAEFGPRRTQGNFATRLPLYDYSIPPRDYMGDKRELTAFLGVLDTPHRERYSRYGTEGHSERFLNLTPRQFYDEIDATIIELGIPIDQVKYLKERALAAGNSEKPADFDRSRNYDRELATLTMPVFIRLLEKGYTRKDLVP